MNLTAPADGGLAVVADADSVVLLTPAGNYRLSPGTAFSLSAMLSRVAVKAAAHNAPPELLGQLAEVSDYATAALEELCGDGAAA